MFVRNAAAALLMTIALTGCTSQSISPMTQPTLVQRTQAMLDAVAKGDKTPWQENFADDSFYFDEKGKLHDKTSLVNDISPLPDGYVGSIAIANPKSHIEERVAVLTYDMDEALTIYGQKLGARYHATDTWMNRNGKWQIVASQVLRYYSDPAIGTVDPKHFRDYAGTYELVPGTTRVVTAAGNDLYMQRGERPREQLLPEVTDLFFRKGVEGRILFRRAENGRVSALVDRRNKEDVVWTRK
jgi:hypothetical protein